MALPVAVTLALAVAVRTTCPPELSVSAVAVSCSGGTGLLALRMACGQTQPGVAFDRDRVDAIFDRAGRLGRVELRDGKHCRSCGQDDDGDVVGDRDERQAEMPLGTRTKIRQKPL